MKNKTLLVIVLALVALAFILIPFAVHAQTNAPAGGFDQKAAEFFTLHFSYWQALLVPACLVVTQLVKKYVAFIPDNLLPFVAPIAGGLLDMAATKFGLWTGNAAVGATMGALATWFHQAYNQNVPDAPDDGTSSPPDA